MGRRNKIIISVVMIGVLGTGIYSCFKNPDFWKISVGNVLTLLVTLVITFLLTQKMTDERRKKDAVAKILDRLYILVSDPRMVKIQEKETVDFVNIQNRTISNKISCLEKFAEDFGFTDDVNKMKGDFDTYEQLFSDHMNDLDYLGKSEKMFCNQIKLLDNGCDNILVKLYAK